MLLVFLVTVVLSPVPLASFILAPEPFDPLADTPTLVPAPVNLSLWVAHIATLFPLNIDYYFRHLAYVIPSFVLTALMTFASAKIYLARSVAPAPVTRLMFLAPLSLIVLFGGLHVHRLIEESEDIYGVGSTKPRSNFASFSLLLDEETEKAIRNEIARCNECVVIPDNWCGYLQIIDDDSFQSQTDEMEEWLALEARKRENTDELAAFKVIAEKFRESQEQSRQRRLRNRRVLPRCEEALATLTRQ